MSGLDTNSKVAAQAVLDDTLDASRFTKRVATTVAGTLGHKPSYADSTVFGGRRHVLKGDEIPAGFSRERQELSRLTTKAGVVTFAAQDRVKDGFDNSEHEVLAPLGTHAAGAIVHEWLLARVS